MGEKQGVEVVISAKDQATDVLKKVAGGFAAYLSVSAVMDFMKDSTAAAAESESAQVKLAQALGRSSDALNEQAAALQKTTKYEDDAVTAAQAAVAAFTRNEASIKRVTAAAVDLAAAKGMDLTSAADLVTKSIYGEMNALGRYGISADGAAGSADRLDSVLKNLNAHFGGQAEAQANTFEGSVAKMKNSFQDLKEEIGGVIARNPTVIAAMGMLRDLFNRLGESIKNNQQFLMSLAQDGIVIFIRAMGVAVDIVGSFVLAWDYLKVAVNGIIYGMVATLEAVISPFKAIWEWLQKITNAKGGQDIFGEIFSGVTAYKEIAHDAMTSSLKDVDATIKKYGELHTTIYGAANAIAEMKASPTTITPAAGGGRGNPDDTHSYTAAQKLASDIEYVTAFRQLMQAKGISQQEQDNLELAQFDMQSQAKLMKLQSEKASQAAIEDEAANRDMARQAMMAQMEEKTKQMRISAANAAASNFIQAAKMMSEQGGAHARKYFSMYKAAATAQALISTYGAAIKAFESMASIPYVGPVLGALAAGAAIALGMAQVKAIRSESMDGGGGGGGGSISGGSVGTYPVNPGTGLPPIAGGDSRNSGGQQISITVQNGLGTKEYWDSLMENEVIPAINRAGDRNVQLTIATA